MNPSRLQSPLMNSAPAINILYSASIGGWPVTSIAADIRSAPAPTI